LLNALSPPPGTVIIARRPLPGGDMLVVRMAVPKLLPVERRPTTDQGFPVTYEIAKPLKIGHS
jgi:hypothetical protein